jgi:hypothetical protein
MISPDKMVAAFLPVTNSSLLSLSLADPSLAKDPSPSFSTLSKEQKGIFR